MTMMMMMNKCPFIMVSLMVIVLFLWPHIIMVSQFLSLLFHFSDHSDKEACWEMWADSTHSLTDSLWDNTSLLTNCTNLWPRHTGEKKQRWLILFNMLFPCYVYIINCFETNLLHTAPLLKYSIKTKMCDHPVLILWNVHWDLYK